ncbi:flavodoxin family protein [Rhodococcus triatomae]|uniref:Multimeric flavodoxin WrbA n=1 Tax=Rhodococcus triatomae TaxID=300028 RepID=A0A1G8L0A4_9NOCA|nr:flavodoxin family protein [Rhodococcus triatomae]QNG20475.1 flavodoxin family protein [Rhodococcus triatomae]QNG23607.1 flavodoxin family protein [Rhodococcus triatomae]SDI49118.1 Multimeric flavodoxin WrbA [Rhodococcus triatomae]
MSIVTVAVVFHSGYGHTARQAESVARGASSVPNVRVHLLDVTDRGADFWTILDSADALVFGAPTYMGSASAEFRRFAEESATAWSSQAWRDKYAAGFTNSAGVNGDKLSTLQSFVVLAAQHGMHWVSLGLPPGWLYSANGSAEDLNRLGGFLGAMAQSPSDAPPAVSPSDSDLRTAEHLGRRVASTVSTARGREHAVAGAPAEA